MDQESHRNIEDSGCFEGSGSGKLKTPVSNKKDDSVDMV